MRRPRWGRERGRIASAEEFREILAEEIPRLKDPRVGFVTVTHVEVTPDLRRAMVYYTALATTPAAAEAAPGSSRRRSICDRCSAGR